MIVIISISINNSSNNNNINFLASVTQVTGRVPRCFSTLPPGGRLVAARGRNARWDRRGCAALPPVPPRGRSLPPRELPAHTTQLTSQHLHGMTYATRLAQSKTS
eukprot:943162-Pyramimonas_sp.AAC.1